MPLPRHSLPPSQPDRSWADAVRSVCLTFQPAPLLQGNLQRCFGIEYTPASKGKS